MKNSDNTLQEVLCAAHPFILAVGSIVLAVVAGQAVRFNGLIKAFDGYGYETIINQPYPAWLNTIIWPFNFNFLPIGGSFAPPSFLIVAVSLFLIWMACGNRKLFWWSVLSLAIAFIWTNLLYEIVSYFFFRPRPFTVLPSHVSGAAQAIWVHWNSYPAGHVKDTAMYSTIIASYLPKLRWILVLFSLFIAFTRVYLGAHYPTDVIAGLIVGYLAGRSAVMVGKLAKKIFNPELLHYEQV